MVHTFTTCQSKTILRDAKKCNYVKTVYTNIHVHEQGYVLQGLPICSQVYADVNILGKNINTINKNKEALLEMRREVGLKVNVQRRPSI
jgi:hypothetical protein